MTGKTEQITDWRGTPIEVGRRVATMARGRSPQRTIGVVTNVGLKTGFVSVRVEERDRSYCEGKHTVLSAGSVLVLTPDLLTPPGTESEAGE